VAPSVHADRRPFLLAATPSPAPCAAGSRARDFVEVEAAALQVSPGNEAHLHAFTTTMLSLAGEPDQTFHLHTSPEFACKKLLAAGEEKIFDFARVWRNRERGPLHHPEFTMLEWYRAGAPYETLMDDCATLLSLAAETAGTRRFSFRGIDCDPFAAPERLSVAQAFDRHAGVDLLASLSASGETDRDALAASATAAGSEWPRTTAGPTSSAG
jgi:lysyl-tRNA synthetase class 2